MQKSKTTNKFYFIWATIFSIFPILVSLLDLISIKTNIDILLFVSFIVFIISILIRFLFLLKKDFTTISQKTKQLFTSTLKKTIPILITVCLAAVLLSSLINNINIHTVIFCSYFIILLCLYKLEKSQQKLMLNILLISTAICCIMGFIHLTGKQMPGFDDRQLKLSLQFYNPNHSAYVMASMIIISIGLMQNSKALIVEIYYALLSLIYSIFIFINGSFGAITFMYGSVFLMALFYIIKFKKFPIKIATSFILLILICLFIEFVPNIIHFRTTPYNYFVEVIDAFNHYFNTNIPIPKMWGSTKDYLSTYNTQNVYTFIEREELLTTSKDALVNSPKSILLGLGAGTYNTYAPHNIFIALTLDFGIIVPICLYLIFILYFVKFFQNKSNAKDYCIAFSILCFILCGFTGSLVSYSGIYLFIILGLGFKSIKQKPQN